MAKYYVSPNGSDLTPVGSNSADLPFKTISRAIVEGMTATDTVVISGTSVNDPIQAESEANSGDGVTAAGIYKGDGIQYVRGGSDVSDGAVFMRSDATKYFQNATGWTLLGNAAAQGVIYLIGSSSIQIPDGSSFLRKTFPIGTGLFRVRVIYKTDAAATLFVTLRNISTGNYMNFATNTWQAPSVSHRFQSSTAWMEASTPWCNGEDLLSNHRFDFGRDGTGSAYVQAFFIEHMSSWDLYSGGVYSSNYYVAVNTPNALWASPSWDSDGVYGLSGRVLGSGKDSLAVGEWYYDSATQKLYYYPNPGEDISTLHIEVSHKNAAFKATGAVTVANIRTFGSRYGLWATTGGRMYLNNCSSLHNYNFGVYASGSGEINATGCDVAHTFGGAVHGDGFFVQDTASMVCVGCTSSHNHDEGFQSRDTANITMIGCLAYKNGGNPFEPFNIGGGTIVVRNSTLVGKKYHALDDKCTGAVSRTYVGNLFILNTDNGLDRGVSSIQIDAPLDGSLSSSGNYHAGSSANSAVKDATVTSTNADPLFTDAANDNYELSASSPCIGVAERWWSGTNPISASGEPYPDFDIDAGGLQSTHGPFHPSNL